ncbi:MAG: hypothetical protein M0Z50_15540 [Planctomycetia bacterium]|nr:hypothetical protein [Planctomycetia bacterium]
MKGKTHALDKFSNRRRTLVHNTIQALFRTRIPTTQRPKQVLKVANTGILLVIIGSTTIGLTSRSAGGYTAGSADYGQVISQLSQLDTNYTELSGESRVDWGTPFPDATGNLSPGANTASTGTNWMDGQTLQNLIASELGPIETNNGPVFSYLGNGETSFLTYNPSPSINGSVNTAGSLNWIPGITAINFPTTETANTGLSSDWSVFIDKYGYPVFESPNGNSYTAWYPYSVVSENLENTAGVNFGNANKNSTTPYSVFKDAYGGSVFENPLGQSYFSDVYFEPHASNSPIMGSVFTTDGNGSGQPNSVFQVEGFNVYPGTTNYGKQLDSNGYPNQMLSVFTAGTGSNSGLGSTGIGSVFVTDDTQNKNVGNSVFLDPYGNSYLDDITYALLLPANGLTTPVSDGGYMLSGGNNWSYNQYGELDYTSLEQVGSISQSLNPLTLSELYAYANGVTYANQFNGNVGTLTPPYQFLTNTAFLEAPTESVQTWYKGYNGDDGQYENMFAEAFFNPPSSSSTTLIPYLSALAGYNPGSTTETTAQTQANADWSGFNTEAQGAVWTNTDYAAPSGGIMTTWNPSATVTITNPYTNSSQTETPGGIILAAGINPGEILQPIADTMGDPATAANETQAVTAADSLLLSVFGVDQIPPNESGTASTEQLDASGLPAYEEVPEVFIQSAFNAMAWWQESMGWLIDMLTVLWLVYCCFSILRWMNWGINGGNMPRLTKLEGKINIEDKPKLEPQTA